MCISRVERPQVKVFIRSACEACDQAVLLLGEWTDRRADIHFTVVHVLDQPEQVVRLGIMYTPALVIDNELLGQKITTQELQDTLQAHFSRPAAG